MSLDIEAIKRQLADAKIEAWLPIEVVRVLEASKHLVAEVERLRAQVEAVKALHEPIHEKGDPPDFKYCKECYAYTPARLFKP